MNATSDDQARLAQSSFIYEKQPNIVIRILRVIDIFSFLPVPKDEAVSTKQSIIGTLLFFTIFLTYITYDFIGFIYNNPPIEQLYRTALDDNEYEIPQFSIAFMTNELNNYTEIYEGLFTYEMLSITKSQGTQSNSTINFTVSNKTGNDLTWMSEPTKMFYYIQRYPTQTMKAKGLLYSTDQNTYIRTKISYCVNSTSTTCVDNDTMNRLSNYGRFFLFIKNDPDNSIISKESLASNGNNYILYNFFVIPGFYKRININFQVVQTTVLPDYFNEFSEKVTTHLQIQSIFEEISVVNYNNQNNTDAIAFNMQLSPIKLKNKVALSTLIDHLSMWGALWGVLFAVFALFFLSYNRRKFYRKNPDWDRFKKALEIQRQQHHRF